MNFSAISSNSRLGIALRYPLNWIPRERVMPVLQGRLRGKRWIIGASNHGCWLGSYEYDKQKLFVRKVKKGDVVYDIGAHVGFYTLLASELVGPDGRVIAFEPLPWNLGYLHRHLALNSCENVTVFEAAVGDSTAFVRFEERASSAMGFVSSQGSLEVEMVSLDELVLNGMLPRPNIIKMDIEGGEYHALEGATRILTENHPTIFLATHSPELHQQCCKLLQQLGYRFDSITGLDFRATDEIICFGDSRSQADSERLWAMPLSSSLQKC